MTQFLLRRITLRSSAHRLLQGRDAGAAISEVVRTYSVSRSTILRMVEDNWYHFGPTLIRTVLFCVALGVSTPGTAQAQVSNSKIVVQEAAAIVHDLLFGGTSLLQYNWNECMTHAAATHDRNFADQCLFYTYGAILADPGFGAHNTQEKLATEQNVSVGLNLLFQIAGLSQDDGWRYLIAEKPLLVSELLKDSGKGLNDERPSVSPPQDDIASIPLTSQDGIFTVPATVNGVLTISFLIDSGASDVNIPVDVFLTLYRTGSISKADFVGTQSSVLADGTIIPSEVFVLRQLQVGSKIARNVIASIGGQNSTLLLGQSFLRQFQSWSIDNKSHVLYLK